MCPATAFAPARPFLSALPIYLPPGHGMDTAVSVLEQLRCGKGLTSGAMTPCHLFPADRHQTADLSRVIRINALILWFLPAILAAMKNLNLNRH